jgi:hypothetical protein
VLLWYHLVLCTGRSFLPEAKHETFPRRDLDFAKTIFIGQLCSTKRKIGCAFGLLTKHFGIFRKPFETKVEVTRSTIRSACAVHTYIRKHKQPKLNERWKIHWNKNSILHCFRWTSHLLWGSFHWSAAGAKGVKRLVCISSWEIKCVALAIWKGNVLVPSLRLI